jgi:hypothetical protein
MAQHNIRVMLSCRHIVTFREPAPVMGDVVYCVKCNRDVTAVEAPDEWRTKCRACPYARPYGAAKLAAGQAAMRHIRKKPTHVVDIINGRIVVETLGDVDGLRRKAASTRASLAAWSAGNQPTLFPDTPPKTETDAPF